MILMTQEQFTVISEIVLFFKRWHLLQFLKKSAESKMGQLMVGQAGDKNIQILQFMTKVWNWLSSGYWILGRQF